MRRGAGRRGRNPDKHRVGSARKLLAFVIAVSLTGATVSCAASPVNTAAVVLTVATPEAEDDQVPEVRQLKHFSDEVTRLSGGTIAMDVHWYEGPGSNPRLDTDVAELVAGGQVDLAMVPARAWDEEGVTSLRALSAPFLITDDTTVQRVLEDQQLRNRLLSGLGAADVVGLDLWPQQPRHLFGYAHPLTSPADLRGQSIRAPRSKVEWSVLRAWGAEPTFGVNDFTGGQAGMESSYSLTVADTATGNLTPFAKVSSLVAGRSVHQRLSRAQWEVLSEAAALTRSWAFGDLPSDLDGATEFCAEGGTIVAAAPADLAALRREAEPVTAALRRDPLTASIMDDIGALKRTYAPPAPIISCPGTSGDEHAGLLAELDGVYSFDTTAAQLIRIGVTGGAIQENSGHFEWTLDHGQYMYVQTADHFIANPHSAGIYDYDGTKITFDPDKSGEQWGAKVTRGRHRELIFTEIFDVRGGQELRISRGLLDPTWRRVGLPR